MKKTFLMIGLGCASLLGMTRATAQTRPDRCGMRAMHKAMIAQDPAWKDRLDAQRASLQNIADNFIAQQADNANARTTTVSAIPVVFHIVVDSAQFVAMGSTAGIQKRCDSQITVLNRDFNRKNLDSTLIPSAWKALYGTAGIHFGLAHTDASGHATPGYEIKIITGSGFSNSDYAFPEAKTAATGLASWDVNSYYNVWCINFTGSATSLLGITAPKSDASFFGAANIGVCILYSTLGKQTTGAGGFPGVYNLGRTLTHETGHFFEIWHPWGDDEGRCPTWSSTDVVGASTCAVGVGQDDGIADTPPESDAVYGNPTYTISGGTYNDCCEMHGTVNTQPIGIACLSFMDYTDDNAMHLFTTQQAAVMAAQSTVTTGENYSLTQHPVLLQYPSSVSNTEIDNSLNVFPNPTTGQLTISYSATAATLNGIVVLNMMGQEVLNVKGTGKDYYSLNLSGMSKGMYIVKCDFGTSVVTKKILLQ